MSYGFHRIIILCMFSGELEVASAKNVILYTTLSNKSHDRENGLCGLLVVTNFKLSFLTSDIDQVGSVNFISFQYEKVNLLSSSYRILRIRRIFSFSATISHCRILTEFIR